MFSLQDLLGPQRGGEAVEEISRNVGADQGAVNSAIQMALPAILGGLANNASSPQGAESLNNALERDHDGGILDNLGSLGGMIFGGGAGQQQQPSALPPQMDAGGILGHVFGDRQGQVAQEVSRQTGLGTGQTAQILMMLAPIVLGYLGRQKREQNLDPGGLSEWLGGQRQQIEQQAPPETGGFLNSILDRNNDGSVMDDIASMAMNHLSNRR